MTAATPENPDSFEVFKFTLESSASQYIPPNQGHPLQQPIQNPPRPAQPPVGNGGNPLDSSIAAQFVDLGGRLQLTNKATNTILQDMRSQASKSESRHSELLESLATKDHVAALDARLKRIEQLLSNVQRDLEGKDYNSRFNQLQDTLRSSHLSLTENLRGHLLSGTSFSLL